MIISSRIPILKRRFLRGISLKSDRLSMHNDFGRKILVGCLLSASLFASACGKLNVHLVRFDKGTAARDVLLSVSDASVAEGGDAVFTVSLSEPATSAVSFDYSTSDGTAIGNQDYTPVTNTTVVIPAGSTSASLTINTLSDTLHENDETFILAITQIVGAGAEDNYGLGTVLNDDSTPTINWSASTQSVSEAVGSVTVTAQLSAVSGLSSTVAFAVSGSSTGGGIDHAAASGTLTISAGSTTASYTFTVVDDNLYESNETVILTLSSASNATLGSTSIQTVTISDNDSAPTVNWTQASQVVGESAGSVSIVAQLSAVSGLNMTLPFTVSGSSTAGGVDHDAVNGTLTINAGSSTAVYVFNVVDDSNPESTETVIFTMGAASGATVGSTSVQTVTISDDDGVPIVNWNASTQTVAEGVGTVTVTAQLSASSGLNVTLPFTVSGSATGGGTDHNAADGTVTITAGATTGSYTFTVTDDSLYELNETVTISMGVPTNAGIGGTNVQVITISDNDTAPIVDWATLSQSVSENVGTVTVTAQLNAVSGVTATVAFSISGSATGGGIDHNAQSSTITITAGSTVGNYTFSVVDDSLYESTETVILTMGSIGNATAGATTLQTVSISDNDTSPSISISDNTVAEGTGGGTTNEVFTVSLSAVSGLASKVDYTTANHTAVGGGTDFTDISGTLTISAGLTSATLTVPVTRDSLYEGDEDFYLNLSNPVNATISDNQGLGTIQDDDSPPAVNWRASTQTVNENVGTATVVAQLSAASGLTTTIPFILSGTATSGGTDYATPSSPITIAAGSTSGSVTFSVVDDSLYESTETVILTMGSIGNATAGATTLQTVSISDNDTSPSISISDNTVAEGTGGGTTNEVFTVSLSAVSGLASKVDYTTANHTAVGGGTDFTDISGTLTISAGLTSATLTVPVTRDSLYEGDEDFYLNLSNPVNATISVSQGVGTIQDDDSAPTVNWSASTQSVNENVGTATVVAQLSAASGLTTTIPFTLSGTATSGGTDYSTPSSPITIAAGSTSGSVTFSVVDDASIESTETVIFTMGSVGNATAGATTIQTISILDNDSPPPSLSVANINVSESVGTATIVVTASGTSASNMTASWASSNGTASSGSDYTASSGTMTITAGQTVGSITVPILDDASMESDETFNVTLSSPSNATLSTSIAVVTIYDDDAALTRYSFQDCSNFPSGLTVTRASIGTYYNSSGVLQTATSGNPRCDHDPITGDPKGLLIEESRQNLMTNSTAISPTWAPYTGSLASDAAATAPDGTTGVWKFTENGASDYHELYFNPSMTANTYYTFSVFFKSSNRQIRLHLINKAGNEAYCYFKFSPLSVVASSNQFDCSIVQLANGWYRSWITYNSATGSNTPTISMGLAYDGVGVVNGGSGPGYYSGDSSSYGYFWGVQYEIGKGASSYIPTSGSTVTRSADNVTVTTPSFLSASEGEVTTQFVPAYVVAGVESFVGRLVFTPGTNSVDIRKSSTTEKSNLNLISGGSTTATVGNSLSTTWSTGTVKKVATAYKASDTILYENAVSGGSNTIGAAPTGSASTWELGYTSASSAKYLNGHLKFVEYRPQRISDSSLQFLSGTYTISGITGGSDSTADHTLANGTTATVTWQDLSGENDYQITIYQSDKTTVQCATATVAANTTSHTFTGCTLSSGQTYFVKLVGRDASARYSNEATNSLFKFSLP